MSDSATPVVNENGSDDEKDDEQVTSMNQKKEDAKVEKELDRVTDRVDEEEIGSENIGNVKILFEKYLQLFCSFRLYQQLMINVIEMNQNVKLNKPN
jgi:hypothetical protein